MVMGNSDYNPGRRKVYNQPLFIKDQSCLLYTSDAADERSSVDLGGRRIIKKKINVDGGVRPQTRNKL